MRWSAPEAAIWVSRSGACRASRRSSTAGPSPRRASRPTPQRWMRGSAARIRSATGCTDTCVCSHSNTRSTGSGLYAGVHSEMAGLPGPAQTPEPVDRVFEWLQTQVSVQPVADLIRAADPRIQRWGVGLLARRGDGPAVDLLREALQAPDRDTQIAASGALQRIEERLAHDITRAQERRRLEPCLLYTSPSPRDS